MSTQTIFTEENKATFNWWKKEKFGDKIEGTLTDIRRQINQLSGKEQTIYELLSAEEEIWLVGGSVGIDAQMKNVKLGQIVGFEYIKEIPNKKKGLNPIKVVQCYHNPKVINEKWLAENENESVINNEIQTSKIPQEDIDIENINFDEVPFESGKTQPSQSSQNESGIDTRMDIIKTLVKEKMNIEVDTDSWQIAVMEKLGLPLISNNFDKVIEKLKAL